MWKLATVTLFLSVVSFGNTACKDDKKLTASERFVLDTHNELRARHKDTQPLCYGETGEKGVSFSSQQWADQRALTKTMKLEHSKWRKFSSRPYGENLYAARQTLELEEDTAYYKTSINKWYSEINNWNFTTSSKIKPRKPASHFAQIVWRKTAQVNCGLASFYDDSEDDGSDEAPKMRYGYHVVCQYFPSGNYIGEEAKNIYPLLPKNPVKVAKPSKKPTPPPYKVATGKVSEPEKPSAAEGMMMSVSLLVSVGFYMLL